MSWCAADHRARQGDAMRLGIPSTLLLFGISFGLLGGCTTQDAGSTRSKGSGGSNNSTTTGTTAGSGGGGATGGGIGTGATGGTGPGGIDPGKDASIVETS